MAKPAMAPTTSSTRELRVIPKFLVSFDGRFRRIAPGPLILAHQCESEAKY